MAFQVPSGVPREIEDFVGFSCGLLGGCPDSGVPNQRMLGKPHASAALQEQTQYYEAGFFGGTTWM